MLRTAEVRVLSREDARGVAGDTADALLYAVGAAAPRALDRGGPLTCVVDGQRTLAGVIMQTDAESEQPFVLSGEDRVARAAGPGGVLGHTCRLLIDS